MEMELFIEKLKVKGFKACAARQEGELVFIRRPWAGGYRRVRLTMDGEEVYVTFEVFISPFWTPIHKANIKEVYLTRSGNNFSFIARNQDLVDAGVEAEVQATPQSQEEEEEAQAPDGQPYPTAPTQ